MCEQGGAHATRGDRPHGHPGPDGDRVRVTLILSPPVRAGQAGKGGDHLSRPLLPAVLPECSLESGGIGSPACPAHLHAQRQPSRARRSRTCSTGSPGGKSPGPRQARGLVKTLRHPVSHAHLPRSLPARPSRQPAAPMASTMPSGSWPKTRPGPVPPPVVQLQIGSAVLEVSGSTRRPAPRSQRHRRPERPPHGFLDQHGCHTTPAQGDPATTRRRDDQPHIT